MQDLGVLSGGTHSYGLGINASGQVVGQSTVAGLAFYGHAFLSSGGVMYDLNDLVTNLASTDFSFLDTGTDINDSGWIVGSGLTRTDEKTHAFLAIPVPEPTSAGLLGLGTLLLAVRRRRSA